MEHAQRPSADLARTVLPAPLLKAIHFLFSQVPDGCCLVGGTALAGFYAGHRHSDDIDLFTMDEFAYHAAINAAHQLSTVGASIHGVRKSGQYFHCVAQLENHSFTIDIVLDPHFFSQEGMYVRLDKLSIATLHTLLSIKLATLVSRCSEKDLYDLIWLFNNFRRPNFDEFVSLGQSIDTGVSDESILISTSGALLTEAACHFAEPGTKASEVFKQIQSFLKTLNRDYARYVLEKKESHPIKEVIRKLT